MLIDLKNLQGQIDSLKDVMYIYPTQNLQSALEILEHIKWRLERYPLAHFEIDWTKNYSVPVITNEPIKEGT